MEHETIYNLLQTLNIPVAYDHFTKKVEPPLILYREDIPNTFKADDKVFIKTNTFVVALVTETKNLNLEAQIESLFDTNHIPYEKTTDFIDSEMVYQTEYTI